MKTKPIFGFISPLSATAVGDNIWRLDNELVYVSKESRIYRVPPGFESDLASIPRVFRLLIPINGRHRAAAVLHDFFDVTKGKLKGETITRAQADALFLEAMESAGVGYFTRYAMYLAVRAAGWMFWGP